MPTFEVTIERKITVSIDVDEDGNRSACVSSLGEEELSAQEESDAFEELALQVEASRDYSDEQAYKRTRGM